MRALKRTSTKWSPSLAYAIGLITTDGSLSIDGRHINFTSKDYQLVKLFKEILNLRNKVGLKTRRKEEQRSYFQIQFGDINFYKFLLSIGLTPHKSKTLDRIIIPKIYFFDFLRGHFDGDGTFYSYWDRRWKSSYMFYLVFNSASPKHILWIRKKLQNLLKVRGHITHDPRRTIYSLKYAKRESLLILRKMYKNETMCLIRKRLKIEKALDIIGKPLI